MANISNRKEDVHFSTAQLKYLEALYPQTVYGAGASEAAMRHYFGQQAVIESVRSKTRGLSANVLPSDPHGIPTPR